MRNLSTLILLLFLSYINFSYDRTEKNIEQKNFIYILNFYPSFHPYCEVQIYNTSKRKEISLRIDSDQDFEYNNKVSANLNESDIENFQQLIKNISLINFKPKNRNGGMDGMTVDNMYYEDEEINKFRFCSPNKNSEESQIIDAIIELSKNKFKNKKYTKYFANIKNYYGQ